MRRFFKKSAGSASKEPAVEPLTRRRGNSPIRASEIGSYLYCQRAWWYQRQGVPSENTAEMRGGTRLHQAHGRLVLSTWLLRLVGYLLALGALALFTIYFTGQFL